MSRVVLVSTEAIDVHQHLGFERMAAAVSAVAVRCRRGLATSWKIVSAWYL